MHNRHNSLNQHNYDKVENNNNCIKEIAYNITSSKQLCTSQEEIKQLKNEIKYFEESCEIERINAVCEDTECKRLSKEMQEVEKFPRKVLKKCLS